MNPPTLPWHSQQWQRLSAVENAGRLAHALLLCGPGGLGKRVFAESFAQKLFCRRTTRSAGACGECRQCRLFAAGSHPDYLALHPEESSKAIRVDQVRVASEFLQRSSSLAGGYKIACIAPAERMNLNAANSLLKTLEEPPANSLLLLVSELPSRLPATIRSRCQRVFFNRPKTSSASAWLAARLAQNGGDNAGRDQDALARLLRLAHGAPLQALAYAESDALSKRRALFHSYLDLMSGKASVVQTAQTWLDEPLQPALAWLLSWQIDAIRLKMGAESTHLNNQDLMKPLSRLSQRQTSRALFQRFDQALELYVLATTTPINTQLQLESFFSYCVHHGD